MPDLRERLRRLPKAELHIHLEGSIRPERMLELTREHFGGAPWDTVEEMTAALAYRDFATFLETFARVCMCLQKPEDFAVLALDYLADAAEQGVVYTEFFISPAVHRDRGIKTADVIAAIADARAQALETHNIHSRVILDISRQMPLDMGWETMREAAALQDRGVVGIGIGGDEVHFPPELYREHFAAAKSEGLGLVAHAGEWAGLDSMRGAMDVLGATRLGHGTAVRHDAAMLREVRDRGIMLDMCPNSNVRTKSIDRLDEHPIVDCLDAGVPISLNSDDPSLFQTSILGEYETLHETFGVPIERLARLGPDAMAWSFADDATRSAVEASMRAAP